MPDLIAEIYETEVVGGSSARLMAELLNDASESLPWDVQANYCIILRDAQMLVDRELEA